MNQCESCLFYVYDEDFDDYVCDADMDQDDAAGFLSKNRKGCPYWRNGDEYATVRRQN